MGFAGIVLFGDLPFSESSDAYVSSAYLTPISDDTATAIARVNVRAHAGTEFKKIGQLKKGQNVVLLGFQGDWAEIVMKDGAIGYVHRDYLA